MLETDSRHKRRYLLLSVALLAALMPIYLSVGSNRAATMVKDRKIAADPTQRAREAGLRAASRTATAGARPSLEMKENVDFMLTPALLVQEALSDDIIITYPSE